MSRKIKDLTGKRSGNLEVIFIDTSSPRGAGKCISWVCRCDCGNTTVATSDHITQNQRTSCGCRKHRRHSEHPLFIGYGKISGTKWNKIKRRTKFDNKTKKRELIPFDITIEYAWDLFTKQDGKCVLSGMDIGFGDKNRDKSTTASLDRIDSNIGYIIGNVQWVHRDVNRMKNDFDQKYFVEICKKITERTK